MLYILTDVSFIYKDYGLLTQKKLEFLDYVDTFDYIEKGIFWEGTMGPMIKASLQFVKAGGQKSVITEAKKLEDRTCGSKIILYYE